LVHSGDSDAWLIFKSNWERQLSPRKNINELW
jgi:hypothetical protein